jgi:hypothetical protein
MEWGTIVLQTEEKSVELNKRREGKTEEKEGRRRKEELGLGARAAARASQGDHQFNIRKDNFTLTSLR